MPHVIDNKIIHDDQKIGWIDGEHIRDMSNNKLGYFENGFVYREDGRKVAYIHENELCYENGESPSALEHINEAIEGNIPILTKCAIKVLLDL
jgi:hypothetical protein